MSQTSSPQALDQQTQALLQKLLQQESVLTNSLQQCLGDERQALGNSDTEGLIDNANKKGQLVNQLESCAQQREALLQQLAMPASREGMQQLPNHCNNSQLQQIWADLSSAAEQCQEENQQLGMLIQREQGNVRQAQHILQRGTPASNHSYDASGQSDSNTKTRNLAKA